MFWSKQLEIKWLAFSCNPLTLKELLSNDCRSITTLILPILQKGIAWSPLTITKKVTTTQPITIKQTQHTLFQGQEANIIRQSERTKPWIFHISFASARRPFCNRFVYKCLCRALKTSVFVARLVSKQQSLRSRENILIFKINIVNTTCLWGLECWDWDV